MKKKLQIHAVAIDQASKLHFQTTTNQWLFYSTGEHKGNDTIKPCHLYATDNSPIQEGDWFISPLGNLCQYANGYTPWDTTSHENQTCKRVVATTNSELWDTYPDGIILLTTKVAKIPDSLIKAFANSQGKLKEVMVEYQDAHYDWINNPNGTRIQNKVKEEQLKLNPDGTIIWSPVEESISIDWEQVFEDAQTMHLQEFITYYKNYPE